MPCDPSHYATWVTADPFFQILLVLSGQPSHTLIGLVDFTSSTLASIAMCFELTQLLFILKFSQLNLVQIHLRSQNILMMDYEGAVLNLIQMTFLRFSRFLQYFCYFLSIWRLIPVLIWRLIPVFQNNFIFLCQINFLSFLFLEYFPYCQLN